MTPEELMEEALGFNPLAITQDGGAVLSHGAMVTALERAQAQLLAYWRTYGKCPCGGAANRTDGNVAHGKDCATIQAILDANGTVEWESEA